MLLDEVELLEEVEGGLELAGDTRDEEVAMVVLVDGGEVGKVAMEGALEDDNVLVAKGASLGGERGGSKATGNEVVVGGIDLNGVECGGLQEGVAEGGE